MEAERSDLGQQKTGALGQTPVKTMLGRGEQSQGSSRPGEPGVQSRQRVAGSGEIHGYYEEAGYPDYENDDFIHGGHNFESHYGGLHPEEVRRGYSHMEGYDDHMDHHLSREGMKHDLKDLSLLNPLLYKPASKPPIIREGDWLCPDPTVEPSN